MSRPLIGNRNSWADFEKCVLEVFILALGMLRNKKSLPLDEDNVQGHDSLNRRLSICLLDAIIEWEKINDVDIVVNPEQNLGKQPDLENEEEVHEYERKKPDFQWKFRDRLRDNSLSKNNEFLSYDIECKRLGINLCPGRNLAKEYVSNGILRFTMNTHCYGQFTSSGLMIGYIQDTDLQAVLKEINDFSLSIPLPELSLSLEGCTPCTSRLDHKLDRPDVEPTPFELRHLWVDLRHHYPQLSVAPKKKSSRRESQTKQKTKSSRVKPKKGSS